MKNFNVFRNGKVHVKTEMCKTCIFRLNGFHLDPGRLESMVRESLKVESAIVCHDTLKECGSKLQAVCRGFFNKYKTKPLRVAESMGRIELQK